MSGSLYQTRDLFPKVFYSCWCHGYHRVGGLECTGYRDCTILLRCCRLMKFFLFGRCFILNCASYADIAVPQTPHRCGSMLKSTNKCWIIFSSPLIQTLDQHTRISNKTYVFVLNFKTLTYFLRFSAEVRDFIWEDKDWKEFYRDMKELNCHVSRYGCIRFRHSPVGPQVPSI